MAFAVSNQEPGWYLKNHELSNFVFVNKGKVNEFFTSKCVFKMFYF